MSIGEHIDALVTYCKSKSGIQFYFGNKEFTIAELPCGNILHDEVGTIVTYSKSASEVSLPLQIVVLVDKSMYRLAYDKIEKVIAGAATFRDDTGLQIYWTEGLQSEEENGIYKVKATITLRRVVK